ncbi:MAG: arginase family protein [Bacteroidales bacterium]|nr:arginase family protein [Bacteroidales bacterium]
MDSVIVNLSGVYVDEGLASLGGKVIDFGTLEGTNCYCDAQAAEDIRVGIKDEPVEAVHWIDTGDYHYISRFWLEKAAEQGPFSLVLFDHHPDMQEPTFEGVLSCGSWARDAFTGIENLKQVLMIGINPDLELEILDLVFDGVLSVTTDDLKHTGDAVSSDVLEMISLLEPKLPVYFSIDKDVLSQNFASTNWDQGCMTLEQLRTCIERVAVSHHVIGADICGGLTREKGGTDADFEKNQKVNAFLYDLFGKLIK